MVGLIGRRGRWFPTSVTGFWTFFFWELPQCLPVHKSRTDHDTGFTHSQWPLQPIVLFPFSYVLLTGEFRNCPCPCFVTLRFIFLFFEFINYSFPVRLYSLRSRKYTSLVACHIHFFTFSASSKHTKKKTIISVGLLSKCNDTTLHACTTHS